jgi:hypothetical protein
MIAIWIDPKTGGFLLKITNYQIAQWISNGQPWSHLHLWTVLKNSKNFCE